MPVKHAQQGGRVQNAVGGQTLNAGGVLHAISSRTLARAPMALA